MNKKLYQQSLTAVIFGRKELHGCWPQWVLRHRNVLILKHMRRELSDRRKWVLRKTLLASVTTLLERPARN